MATKKPKNLRTGWTVAELRAIKSDWAGDRLSDGNGLVGDVRVSQDGKVSIRFQYAFRFAGKAGQLFQCGTWPTLELSEIRENRDRARAQVKAGVDPRVAKAAEKIEAAAEKVAVIAAAQAAEDAEKTFQDLFDAWIQRGVHRSDGNKEVRRIFGKDILPALGQIKLQDLRDSHVHGVVKGLFDRDAPRLAIMVHGLLGQMIRWGEARKPWRALLIDGNPVALVDAERMAPASYSGIRDRVLSDRELQELANKFREVRECYAAAPAGKKYDAMRPIGRKAELAVWLCLGTLCRIGEVTATRWKDIDFDTGVWSVPRLNTKSKVVHFIFLSPFVRRVLETLRELTGGSEWLFPAENKDEGSLCPRTTSKQIGDRQARYRKRDEPMSNRVLNDSLSLDGGKWTPHDMRRTGATFMVRLGVSRDLVNRCQNHARSGESEVDKHYIFYEYEKEMTDAWARLGTHLDSILPHEL